jgi:acetylglutamate/LysW-gamma-L-alpha-aminoadipate kinase
VALSEEFEPLNVDGDRTAANVAGALQADVLILLTDVAGLSLDGKLVPKLRPSEAKDMLSKIGPGMITKVHAATEAFDKGVKEVVIASGMGRPLSPRRMNHQGCTVISDG